MSCPGGFSVLLHYYWESSWFTWPISYRRRRIIKNVIKNGIIIGEETVGEATSWEDDYMDTIYHEELTHATLDGWHEHCDRTSICIRTSEDYPQFVNYFTVDPSTRARCFPSGGTPSPTPLNGKSSPPPKRKKEMCCPCDVIATMIERSMAEKARQSELIKNHIDQRFIEALKNINQQLGAIQIDLDLDPVIQEIRQVRTDLWNGVGGKD